VKARLNSRPIELDDDEVAIEFWQSDFPDSRWSIDRALRSFLRVKGITWEGDEDDYDHLYDTTVSARPQDGDYMFWQSG
jgi:hypothetical protein